MATLNEAIPTGEYSSTVQKTLLLGSDGDVTVGASWLDRV